MEVTFHLLTADGQNSSSLKEGDEFHGWQVEKIEAEAVIGWIGRLMTTALHQWRYQPGSRNGAPEAMWREMKVTFTCTVDGRDNCDPNGARTKHRPAVALERVSAR
jgi:hypothetical protein